MNAPIVIIGMHRSGTTMLAKLLQGMDIFIGGDIDANAESHAILQMNEELLRLCSANWDHPLPFLEALRDADRHAAMVGQLRKMLQSQVALGFMGGEFPYCTAYAEMPAVWAFKDPRTTLTLPVWEAALGKEIKVIAIERHGVDVAASLVRRFHEQIAPKIRQDYAIESIPSDHLFRFGAVFHSGRAALLEGAFTLWQEYQQAAHQQRERLGKTMLWLRYEALLENPEAALAAISDFIGLTYNDTKNPLLQPLKKDHAYRIRQDAKLCAFAASKQSALKAYGWESA